MPTNKNLINLIGHTYGRLTVFGYAGKKGKHHYWRCSCDCSKRSVVTSTALRSGHTKSCGCYHKERTSEVHLTHGKSSSPEYRALTQMKARCYKKNNKAYKDYGGRGITICDRWLESFENFYADMGDRLSPQHSIDRINNNGNYEPDNCRWATKQVQNQNHRMFTTNTSGITGVYWSKSSQNWNAVIHISGKRKNLGYFADKSEAATVRRNAEKEHYV